MPINNLLNIPEKYIVESIIALGYINETKSIYKESLPQYEKFFIIVIINK